MLQIGLVIDARSERLVLEHFVGEQPVNVATLAGLSAAAASECFPPSVTTKEISNPKPIWPSAFMRLVPYG